MNSLRIYRERMRNRGSGYRPGSIYRSRREATTTVVTSMVTVALVAGVLRVFSLPGNLILWQVSFGCTWFVGWFAWIVWGRDRFPLGHEEGQQINSAVDCQSPTHLQTARGKAVFWICSPVAVGLLGFVAWLDLSAVSTLAAWLLIGAVYSWIVWSLQRPLTPMGNASDRDDQQHIESG